LEGIYMLLLMGEDLLGRVGLVDVDVEHWL